MTVSKGVFLTICAAFALNGCVNAATQVTNSVSNPSANAAALTASDCPAASGLGSTYDTTISTTSFDAALFDGAVLHFTNVRRCANGLAPLRADSGLRGTAAGHSRDMASANFFSHTSPTTGDLKARIDASGVGYRALAENIATRSRLQMQSGRQFFVVDRGTCQFSYQQGGSTIQPHSYRSLAQEFVKIWEESPEHRVNMFSRKYTRLGSGGSFKSNSANCGDIVATQNFAA